MGYTLDDFNRCCSEDDSQLAYPRFSAVFLQTFCIHDALQFVVPRDAVLSDMEYDKSMEDIRKKAQENAVAVANNKGTENVEEGWIFKSLAEMTDRPVVYMPQDIEKQIFITSEDDRKELMSLRKSMTSRIRKKSLVPYDEGAEESVYVFDNSSVYRFSMKGFDFSVPIKSEKKPDGKYKIEPVTLSGHANVELSLFYGNTVSIAYKFFFDGHSASIFKEGTKEKTVALTDHLIILLSCHLGAEYWSEKNKEEGSIELFKEFNVDKIWIDKDGKYNPEGERIPSPPDGEKRIFNEVLLRYKKYLYEHCTAYRKSLGRKEKAAHEQFRKDNPLSVSFDHHYAMVDIWGDVRHVMDGSERDVFAENDELKLSEPDVISHIRDYHKPELIGLMTLYPSEWRYRDAETFDYVCGESVAIDTDDLVLVGTHMALVVGTYDRRGAGSVGIDWKAMAKTKAKYQVAWPEYLLILQFVLAKKVVIGRMKDRIIDLTKKTLQKSTDNLIFQNARFSLDLTRQILQLDVVKYAKFASHRVMYDRTMERLNVNKDIEEIHDMSEMLSDNLQNLSNYQSMEADSGLNTILLIVSIVSACELMYQDPDFKFWSKMTEDGFSLPAFLIALIFVIVIVALGSLGFNRLKKFYQRKRGR